MMKYFFEHSFMCMIVVFLFLFLFDFCCFLFVCVCVLDSVFCFWDHNLFGNSSDVDECENNGGGCDEKCTNTVGSFKCLCETFGKVLSEDGKTCQCKYFITPLWNNNNAWPVYHSTGLLTSKLQFQKPANCGWLSDMTKNIWFVKQNKSKNQKPLVLLTINARKRFKLEYDI